MNGTKLGSRTAYYWVMTPWFRMPGGDEAVRQAALDALRCALGAIRCAALLIELGTPEVEREHALARAVLDEVDQAEEALRRISR